MIDEIEMKPFWRRTARRLLFSLQDVSPEANKAQSDVDCDRPIRLMFWVIFENF